MLWHIHNLKKKSVLRNTSIKNEFTEDGSDSGFTVAKGRINESVNRSKEKADAMS